MPSKRTFAALPISLLAVSALVAGCSSSGGDPDSSTDPGGGSARYQVTATPTDQQMSADDAAAMDKAANKALAESTDGTPGMIVGIWDPEKGYHVGAYGDAATGKNKTAASAEDHSFIGSITKTATAAAVLQQVDAGTLTLEETVAEADPELGEKFPTVADITIERLLNMSSGIPDYANQEKTGVLPIILKDPQTEFSPDDLIREGLEAAPQQPVGTPGYSTTNYIILGELLAKATGKSPEAAVTAVFDELGLDQSALPDPKELPPPPFTRGYLGEEQSADAKSRGEDYPGDTDVTGWNRSWARSGGGAYSTIDELKDFAASAMGTTLLSPELGDKRLTPATLMPESIVYGPYGLGVFRKGDWVGHTGQLIGWEGLAQFNLATGAVAVALVNSTGGLSAADTVIEEFFPEISALWQPDPAEVANIPNKPAGYEEPAAAGESAGSTE